jgi:four helix bundle protein
MAFAFEKPIVWQTSIDFADQICSRSESFPRGYGFLSDQLNRAALSISANIAEGNGRFTKPDRKNFFGIARGSVQECVPDFLTAPPSKNQSSRSEKEESRRLSTFSDLLRSPLNSLLAHAPPQRRTRSFRVQQRTP